MPLPTNPISKLLFQMKNDYKVLRTFKPLEIGIHKSLIRIYSDQGYSSRLVRRALLRHTSDERYTNNFAKYQKRFDINNKPVSALTESDIEEQMEHFKILKKKIKAAKIRKAENLRAEQELLDKKKEREAKASNKPTLSGASKKTTTIKKRKTLSLKK
ncbi:TPA: ProQ/FINO family protein [Vibrio parahaemolyticus]